MKDNMNEILEKITEMEIMYSVMGSTLYRVNKHFIKNKVLGKNQFMDIQYEEWIKIKKKYKI